MHALCSAFAFAKTASAVFELLVANILHACKHLFVAVLLALLGKGWFMMIAVVVAYAGGVKHLPPGFGALFV